MHRLINKDRTIIALLFPLVLFSSYGGTGSNASLISKHELQFMELLHNYIFQQANGDHALAANILGVANELTSDLQEV